MKLHAEKTGLLIVDVQEKLFPHIDHACDILERIILLIKGFQILDLPIYVSEQYPKGLEGTIRPIKDLLKDDQVYFAKTSFSILGDKDLKEQILSLPIENWVVSGIEAHVCVLQTVFDLLEAKKNVIVANDAISSRSVYDFSTSIADMRDEGARISSTETILFELLKDAKHPGFKEFSSLIK